MSADTSAEQPRLDLVVLRVADLDRAERFYAALGLSFVKHRHGSGPEHYASESEGGVVELYPMSEEGSDSTRSTRIGFQVASVDAVIERALAAGGQIVRAAAPSPWGRRAVLADPEGHRVELREQPAEQAPGPEK